MPIDLLLALSGLLAGAFGALLGLGGGILIVPILTLGFGAPLPAAVGTSLICVIATSTGAAAINVRAGRADVRLGITLGVWTVLGAVTGGLVAGYLPAQVLAGLFAGLIAYTCVAMGRQLFRRTDALAGPALQVDPTRPDGPKAPAYRSRLAPVAAAASFGAGNVSGLLGVGGGIIVVPLVNLVLRAPLQVAVATSNFMIGITAGAGAFTYLFRGDLDPRVAAPVVLGTLAGAILQARFSPAIPAQLVRLIFVVVLAYVALQMAFRALGV